MGSLPDLPVRATYGIWHTDGMEKTTVYLSDGTGRRLRTLSARTGRTQAELIREALDRYLLREDGFRMPSWVGAWGEGPPTDAATVKQEARATWAADLLDRPNGSS